MDPSDSPYHAGEIAVQRRAGVRRSAAHLAGLIRPELPRHADAFLADQRFAIVGAADAAGRVWATMVAGEAGVLRAPDHRTLLVGAAPAGDDPLAGALADAHRGGEGWRVGLLAIDLATRRRLRVNGVAERDAHGALLVRVRQAYWICPKYIQRRVPAATAAASVPPDTAAAAPRRSPALTDAHRALIARADTFFIASAHPTAGADASHRGGHPGFVRVTRTDGGEDVVLFPDYPGNNMFNTFGNLAVDPAAGLLFVDFEGGGTLHLTGTAEVLWEAEQLATWPGADRAVRFRVADVLERPVGSPLRLRLVERSPFNPPPRGPAERSGAGRAAARGA